MRSCRTWIATVVVGVGTLAAQPLIGQQKPAAQTRPAPATTAKPATTTTKPTAAPREKTSNNPPEWWYLGKTDEDDLLFMDAANLVEQDGGFITFRAFYYYGQPRVTTATGNGGRARIAYEKIEAWMGCADRELSDEKQAYFGPDDKEVVVEPTYEDMMKLEATRAGAAEYAFVCNQERAGGAHKFERILTDPLTYVRKKK